MDEFQFIESLDALLANEVNEAMDETTTAADELANTILLNNSNNTAASSLSFTNTNTNTNPHPLLRQGIGIIMGTTCNTTGRMIHGNANNNNNNNNNNNWFEGNTNRNIHGNQHQIDPISISVPIQSAMTNMTSIGLEPSNDPSNDDPSNQNANPLRLYSTTYSPSPNNSINAGVTVTVASTNTSTNGSTTSSTSFMNNSAQIVQGPLNHLQNRPRAAVLVDNNDKAVSNTNAVSNTVSNTNTVAIPSGATSVCSANSQGSCHNNKSQNGNGSINSCADSAGTKSTKSSSSRKRSLATLSSTAFTTAVSESEDESSRKRHDRNLREQRRSQKITNQIDQLREVLAAASVRFKPDKYSTLVSVVDYVRRLQIRSSLLDAEHKKLLDTITRTNEIVNEPYLSSHSNACATMGSSTVCNNNNNDGMTERDAKPDPSLSSGDVNVNVNTNGGATSNATDVYYNEDELVFVRNVDYKCIFERCGMPLAVARIDGRLIDCNDEFVKLTGYKREELLPVEQLEKQQQQLQDSVTRTAYVDVDPTYFPESAPSSSGDVRAKAEQAGCSTTAPAKRVNNCTTTPVRNFSLFNLLSRDNMEEVFVSLSEMLKHPPEGERKTGSTLCSPADYWSGTVRFSRNSHLQIRMNISLVRSPQDRAKFFDCSLTPLAS